MDTSENIESPVGGEGATSSQDTDSQVTTQTTEDSLEDSQGVSDTQESEKEAEVEKALLAGKYKSPEELEKAYKELESKLGEKSEHSELAKALEEQTGMTASQIRDYIAQQRNAQLQQQYQANPQLYTAQEIQQLKGQIALQAEERKLDKFLEKQPEYEPFRDKLRELALNLPKYRYNDDIGYDEIAKEYFGEARAKGQQDAYKKIDTKQMTQATGVSQAPPKSKLTLEDMDKMTAAELEQVLPWADTSNRL